MPGTIRPSSGSFADTPLKVPPIKGNVYQLKINRAELKDNAAKDDTNLVVNLQVFSDGAFKGRPMTHYLPQGKPDPETAMVRTNRFFKAAGCELTADGGYNIDDLNEKIISARVVERTYTDANGVQQEGNNIQEVWVPGEPDLAPPKAKV